MIIDFALTAEGFTLLQKFSSKFNCRLRIDEPDGNELLLDTGEDSYRINMGENVAEFKAVIEESLKTGKNLLLEKYKGDKVHYAEDVLY